MIRIFKSKERLEAVAFSDSTKDIIQAIIAFTGLSVTVEYATDGTVRAGLIKNVSSVHIVNLGQFIYKDSEGNIGVCDLDYLRDGFEEITE
ncbi:hypothetical protein FHR92_005097 [Fontibacillus solani]|uniref:Uncharacterized protein n=1 Tax=Fontibacillus solani TaxID=1572857 RepID=A0A7W3XUD0_9BACL|nr:hypothetical protein [Fontibacillus solani]MBA9088580.1 hypothetical protein [Fontibacillus solani]